MERWQMHGHGRSTIAVGLVMLALIAMEPSRVLAEPPPLFVRGELKKSDAFDHIQRKSYAKLHEVELKAGQAILVELRSVDFDPMLRVEDAKGRVLGQNDDIVLVKDLNSRLGFVAPRAGTYRLVVTTYEPGQNGEYVLEAAALEELRLCVLSACETSLGDLGPLTGESVQGLPRALHLAGCPNVVSSLWNVNDQATAALMAKLYSGLWQERKSPLEALRQAQLLVYRHPEWIAELVERGPTAAKKLQIPPGTVTEKGSETRAATKLWAGFVFSGSGR